MNVSGRVECRDFPCIDVVHARYTIPSVEIDLAAVQILMISEAPPPDPSDDFYAPGDPWYLQTTLQAFDQAGIEASSVADLIAVGVYITTAVKCGKTGYAISAQTVRTCSEILEQEIALFPNVKAYLLMGDVAIRALNYIAKRETGERVIPSGSTYKIRGDEYYYRGLRVFPSYLQTGKSFLIEKSKRAMIAEDIQRALVCVEA
jgi:uracil-DNA glycosylase